MQNRLPLSCPNELESSLFHSGFSYADLERSIESMPKRKSPSSDGILPEFISHLGPVGRQSLLTLMNKTLIEGFPSEWRKADVVPIPKKGKDTNIPANCRPIALTSMLSRVYERMVLDRLQCYLEQKKSLTDKQAAFRRNRNTVEHVAYLSQEVKNAFNRKQSTVAVFTDLRTCPLQRLTVSGERDSSKKH